ncbi:MAG: agmatine deiminase family protein, partial [Candidatus Omnitrophota bacterium]
MPIQISKDKFVQFQYDPCYLRGSQKAIASTTDAVKAYKVVGMKPQISDIRVDGGNIVKSRTKVIMTDRVLCENPQLTKEQLIKKLKIALKVKQVIIIPQCPDDPFGHADGMIRFVDGVRDEKTVLVNNY